MALSSCKNESFWEPGRSPSLVQIEYQIDWMKEEEVEVVVAVVMAEVVDAADIVGEGLDIVAVAVAAAEDATVEEGLGTVAVAAEVAAEVEAATVEVEVDVKADNLGIVVEVVGTAVDIVGVAEVASDLDKVSVESDIVVARDLEPRLGGDLVTVQSVEEDRGVEHMAVQGLVSVRMMVTDPEEDD